MPFLISTFVDKILSYLQKIFLLKFFIMAGPKHKFKYTIGDRINDSFTILREYRQPTNQITHPYE